jgi:hypothetical protein
VLLTTTGGTDDEVQIRVRKANAAFVQLHSVWKAKEISTKTQMIIFSSSVKSSLLYECEAWKVTKKIINSPAEIYQQIFKKNPSYLSANSCYK